MNALRRHWRNFALAATAAVTLGSIAPASATPTQSTPLSGGADSLSQLTSDAQTTMARLAPNRRIIVLSPADFDGRITEQTLRSELARHMPAADVASITQDRIEGIVEGLGENMMAATRVDATNGRRYCIVMMDRSRKTAQAYAAALAGVPASVMTPVTGSADSWRLAGLFHEAAHCGQNNRGVHIFDFAGQLNVERDADQRMINLVQGLPAFSGIAAQYRDVRAIASLHYSAPSHMTAAGLQLRGESAVAGATDGARLLTSMQNVTRALHQQAGRMIPSRTDIHVRALAETIDEVSMFTPAAEREEHPLLSRRHVLIRDLRRMGVEAFGERYAAQGISMDDLYKRSGALLAQETADPATYQIFARAAQAVAQGAALARDPRASRFLTLYRGAVTARIRTTPVATLTVPRVS